MAKNAINLGVEVLGWTPNPTKYKNDNIHPCVRYISGGMAGHKWWMVTTPFFSSDSTMENPILYFGDSRTGDLPPLEWSGGVVVEGTPTSGYNSDGAIHFDGTGLWIFWRENYTPSCTALGVDRAVFGKYTTDGVTFTAKKAFATNGFNITPKGDDEMCPIIFDVNGQLHLYGAYYQFEPTNKPYGIAIFNIAGNDLVNNAFVRQKTVGMLYKKGFDFWHFDLFETDGKYYCVATPAAADEILLGVSDDGENFKFWGTPLLSTAVAGSVYMYKPTAMVHQGIFYLWHPVKIAGRSRIYMSQRPFSEVLNELNNGISKLS